MTPYEVFRDRIDAQSATLMDELEDYAGQRIAVDINTPSKKTMSNRPRAANMTILVPIAQLEDKNAFCKHDAAHELVHIYRYWIEKTPRIESVPNSIVRPLIEAFGSDVEHLAMVPKEIELKHDPIGYWSKLFEEKFLAPLRSVRSGDELGGKNLSMYRQYLTAGLNLPEQMEEFHHIMQKWGLNHLKGWARKSPDPVKRKLASARYAFQKFDIPHPHVRVVTFDIRNRREIVESL